MHKQFRTFPQLVMVGLLASALAAFAQVSPSPERGQASPAKAIDPDLLRKATAGDVMSQRTLGFFYLQGLTVRKDYAQAEVWLRKAAEQGDIQSQNLLAKASHGTMNRLQSGGARPQTKGMHLRNTIWACFTAMAKALKTTTLRRPCGLGRRPSKGTQAHKTPLACAIKMARAFHRTSRRQQSGIARRLSKERLTHKTALGCSSTQAEEESSRILRKPRRGFARQPNKALPRRRRTLARSSCLARVFRKIIRKPISGWLLPQLG